MATPRWNRKTRCSDPAYLHPVLLPKVTQILSDVQAHFDPDKVQIRIFETGRSIAMQRGYVARGVSKTLRSKHLTGRACDIVPFVRKGVGWQPIWQTLYSRKDGRTVWELIASSAKVHGLNTISWDGPHVELPDSVPDD